MKRASLMMVVALALAILLAGCNGQVRRVTREANSLTAAYVVRMDKGLTTRDQDQRFIRAMSSVAYEVDRNVRGTKKAGETRKASQKLSGSGIDADTDMNLDRGVNRISMINDGRSAEDVLREIEDLARSQ